MNDQALIQTVEKLINAGCHYRIEELESLYSPDFTVHILQEDSSLLSFDYEQCLDLFRSLRDSEAPPLDTAANFHFAEVQGGVGFVMVTRTMNLLGDGSKKIVFNLTLKETAKGWQVSREHAVVIGDA